MALKSARIVDFCGKSSGFADSGKHSGLLISCEFWRGFRIVPVLMFGSWVLNQIWIVDLSSALVGMLMSLSKLFRFSNKAHLNSGMSLLLELYCVIVIKRVAFFTICAELTMELTFTSLPLNFNTLFLDVVAVSDLNKNIGGSTDLTKI